MRDWIIKQFGNQITSKLMYHPPNPEDVEMKPDRPILYKVKGYEDKPSLVAFHSDTTQERVEEQSLFTRKEVKRILSAAWDTMCEDEWVCYDEAEGFWETAMDSYLYGKK